MLHVKPTIAGARKQSRRLSPNFSLSELTKTGQPFPNSTDDPTIIANLTAVCVNVLEKVRDNFGKPIMVHSGYRSPAVNKAIGGSVTSQHMTGQAADFHVVGFSLYEVATWIDENLEYDQLILENFIPGETKGWVHCSFKRSGKLRQQALTKFRGSNKFHAGLLLKEG